MRRNLSLGCLFFAWLCANGALWNVVQVVAWAKMYHDYSRIMPAARALQITFDGSAPCELCRLSQSAEETARQQLPRDAALGGGMEKLLLVSEGLPVVVVTAPEFAWPGVMHDVFVQLPVYQRVNGQQLEPRWVLSLGMRVKL